MHSSIVPPAGQAGKKPAAPSSAPKPERGPNAQATLAPANGDRAMTSGKDTKLKRTAFHTNRLMDYCSVKELISQTGHDVKDWPLVVVKELTDNGLDACEDATIAPEITVTVDQGGITVADNGPGLPESTIEGILDFDVRTSSNWAYVSPTRGQLGNGLKTIVPMGFALGDGHGRVDITSCGRRREIVFRADRISQQPVITTTDHASNVKNGTVIELVWPDSACSLLSVMRDRLLQLALDYAYLNPHLTLTLTWFGKTWKRAATRPDWPKWRPNDPTLPHWYTIEDFERQVAAYIAHDRRINGSRYVRDLVTEFRGLSGTAKQKAVLAEAGMVKMPLSALVDGGDLRHDLTVRLLAAMQQHSRAVKPALLGVIGREHLEKRFAALGCEMRTFQYHKACDMDKNGLPSVIETAFAWPARSPRSPAESLPE